MLKTGNNKDKRLVGVTDESCLIINIVSYRVLLDLVLLGRIGEGI